MARTLTLTLTRTRSRFPSKSFPSSSPPPPSSFLISHSIRAFTRRCFSAHAPKAQLLEIDLDSSCDAASDVEVLGIKRLEEVIHSIIARRSAPDWLPFRPGSSFWVPPSPRAGNIAELVDKFANPLTEEEVLSFTSVRGWPSTSFFLEGLASSDPVPVELDVRVHVLYDADRTLESEDEE